MKPLLYVVALLLSLAAAPSAAGVGSLTLGITMDCPYGLAG
jgi:hypothetical protein